MLTIFGVEVDEGRLATICERYGISELQIFGSQARGAARPDSDIDVLYTLRPGRRLGWEIEQLTDELSELFGGRVDLCRDAPCTRSCGRQSSQKPGRSMQRDILLLTEMIDAAEELSG